MILYLNSIHKQSFRLVLDKVLPPVLVVQALPHQKITQMTCHIRHYPRTPCLYRVLVVLLSV